jgi:catechol 2,3-dioxygenase-like lactoylglutathione lyase family enzyme
MLTRLFHLAVNTTDMDKSLAFYERLGFNVLADRTVVNDMVKEAFMVPSGNLRFVHLRLGDSDQATLLDIVEWRDPETAPGFDRPLQHQRGITRFAVLTDDTQKIYDELSAEGVEFLTQPTSVLTPEGGWKIALLVDPDGVVVQVTELLPAP